MLVCVCCRIFGVHVVVMAYKNVSLTSLVVQCVYLNHVDRVLSYGHFVYGLYRCLYLTPQNNK